MVKAQEKAQEKSYQMYFYGTDQKSAKQGVFLCNKIQKFKVVHVFSLDKGYIISVIQDPSSEKVPPEILEDLSKMIATIHCGVVYPKELSEPAIKYICRYFQLDICQPKMEIRMHFKGYFI